MRSHKTYSTTVASDATPRRTRWLAVGLGVWVLLILGKLFYLQLWQHDFLTGYARSQQTGQGRIYGQRGLVLDRAGRELARSVWASAFYAEPRKIEDTALTAHQLAPLLKVPENELRTRLQKAKEANRAYLPLARQVDDNTAALISKLQLKGIGSQPAQKRVYRNGSLAAHILGIVGFDGQGATGLELASNNELQGAPGKTEVEKDGKGQVYERWETESQDGRSLILTVDTTMQYRTEQVLAAAVAHTKAKSGMAVVMDPRTGGILALANVPTFDPNEGYNLDDDDERTAAEKRADKLRFINQAVQLVYEPGSTFKVVAYSGALEEGLTNPNEKMRCGGSTNLGGVIIEDHNASGILPLNMALAKSSNTAAVTLGRRLGEKRLYDYVKRFGFGTRTGVEVTGESRGILRDVKDWSAPSVGTISIGQEISITPIQLAAAYSAIANDGVRMTPHLIQEIRDSHGVTLAAAQPKGRRVVSEQTAKTMRKMLEGVILHGTAKLAKLSNGYTVAGKTGTAQKYDPALRTYSKTKHIASFVGMAPADKPDLVIAIVIDEPVGADHGGEVAAPVFHDLAEQILPLMKVNGGVSDQPPPAERIEVKRDPNFLNTARVPQDSMPGDTPQPDGSGRIVRLPGTKEGFAMPDLRGKSLAEVGQICVQLGLDAEMKGQGKALHQMPAPGAAIQVGHQVVIEFGTQ